MSTSESERPEIRQALQDAMNKRYCDPVAQPTRTEPHNIHPWGDESVQYVPPSKGNDGQNAGE